MRELCFANECPPVLRRVRKRLGSRSGCSARAGTAGHCRAHRRIDSFLSFLGVQNAPLFRPRSGRTIYYFHFLWIHFLKRFCAFNKKPYIAVGSRSYFLRSFCVLDRHYEPLFTFKNLCRLHLTSMSFCSVFCVFLFPISGIFALMFLS